MSTSQVYNAGTAHIGRGGNGGAPVCNNRRAHMTFDRTTFKLEPKQCVRCAAKLAKWEARG